MAMPEMNRPCPFCGGTNLMVADIESGNEAKAWVICEFRACFTHGPIRKADTQEEAIAAAWAAWNEAVCWREPDRPDARALMRMPMEQRREAMRDGAERLMADGEGYEDAWNQGE